MGEVTAFKGRQQPPQPPEPQGPRIRPLGCFYGGPYSASIITAHREELHDDGFGGYVMPWTMIAGHAFVVGYGDPAWGLHGTADND